MKLQGAIKESLGLAVSITKLYRASTLSDMCAHLNARTCELLRSTR